MLFLVSGASCTGKSTARQGALPLLGERFAGIELRDLGEVPEQPTVAWRQEMVERAVQLALALESEGRHLLLAGDPVPAAEILAAPSGDRVRAAACLLDLSPELHAERLRSRGEPEELIPRHLAWADWLRAHAQSPTRRLEAVLVNSWPEMAWERLEHCQDWAVTVLDVSASSPDRVARAVADWCQAVLAGKAPLLFTPAP